MKHLIDFLEGAGHIKNRLGGGSSGVAYDLGNGYVRKTLRVTLSNNIDKTPRGKELRIIEKWSKIKKDLRVIPYIKDFDWEGYTIEKCEPCEEATDIANALDNCLFSSRPADWNESKIEKLKKIFGEEKAQWLMKWFEDFYHDWVLITGEKRMSDDLRTSNIGKTKDGRVVAFDWFDPYCW